MRKDYVLWLFLVFTNITIANERPNVTVDGDVLRWQPVVAGAINVHKADGSFVVSLTGDATSWNPTVSGRYYLVATNNGSWTDWPVSDQVDVDVSGEVTTLPGQFVVSQESNSLQWELPPYTHRMNVHLEDGTYLTTLPAGSRSWTPTSPGSYYLVASTPVDWTTWFRSNTVAFNQDNTTPVSPGEFQIRVDGNTLAWSEVVGATGFNIHATRLNGVDTGGSDYITSIPGTSTSWQPGSSGQYFIQAVVGSDWTNWQRSNLLEFVSGSSQPEPGICTGDNSLSLVHSNGLTYCVDKANRNFSAVNADGSIWWELNLPGDNASNEIKAVIALGEHVALIADKTPATNSHPYYLENDRYEMSVFEAGGVFVDTRKLLPVPDSQEYVALCQDTINCMNHTSSHRLSLNSNGADWQFERFENPAGVASSSIINGDRLNLLLGNLIEFAGRDHIDNAEEAYLSFRSDVNDSLTLVESPTTEERADAYHFVRPSWVSSPTADVLYRCPNNGTLLHLRASNPVATSLRDCSFASTLVDGSYARSIAHRTDASFFENLTITDSDQTVQLTGGYFGGFGYPYNNRGYTTSDYRRSTSGYTLVATNLQSDWYGGSSTAGGSGFSGYTGTAPDGRLGQIYGRGSTQADRTFSFEMTDTRLDNQTITTEASLSRKLNLYEFILESGTRLADQDVVLALTSTSGNTIAPTTFRLRSAAGPIYNWMYGGVTMQATDGSRLIISPTAREDSPLGSYELFAAGNDVPSASGFINLQSVFVGFGR